MSSHPLTSSSSYIEASRWKKNIIVFGKITGIGWFVVILTLISVLLGRWIGNKLGMPILFASVSGIIGVIISLVGIRASIKDILNGK